MPASSSLQLPSPTSARCRPALVWNSAGPRPAPHSPPERRPPQRALWPGLPLPAGPGRGPQPQQGAQVLQAGRGEPAGRVGGPGRRILLPGWVGGWGVCWAGRRAGGRVGWWVGEWVSGGSMGRAGRQGGRAGRRVRGWVGGGLLASERERNWASAPCALPAFSTASRLPRSPDGLRAPNAAPLLPSPAGLMHLNGWATKPDQARAVQLFEVAAKVGPASPKVPSGLLSAMRPPSLHRAGVRPTHGP